MSESATSTEWVTGTWTIDPSHSEVGFTVRHLMSKVRGQFKTFEGTVTTGATPANTRAEATIDLSSVDTNEPKRDAHLKSADFFDIEKNGPMTFSTTSFDGEKAVGELTINGVTKPVELDVDFFGFGADPWGGTRAGWEASTEITRQDWGINFQIPVPGGERAMIGDKVTVNLNIEAVLKQD